MHTVDSDRKPPRPKLPARERLIAVLPQVWELIRPRRGILAVGFLLMVINRVSGLVLPYSTKYLIDSVIIKHNIQLLKPLVLGVLALAVILLGIWPAPLLAASIFLDVLNVFLFFLRIFSREN